LLGDQILDIKEEDSIVLGMYARKREMSTDAARGTEKKTEKKM